jgi:hypothetical protein
MKIHTIHDLTNRAAVDILRDNLSLITDTNIVKNYHPDWGDQPGNLFYILEHGRYRQGRGKYYIITDDSDKYMCSAGWNEYELDKNVALMLTRMYVAPGFRCQYILGNTVLPEMIEAAGRYKHIWITSNNHNRAIYLFFERAAGGKKTALFNDWPPIYKKFKPLGQKTVYYTQQWVAEYDRT